VSIVLRAIAIEDASEVHRICAHADVARTLGGLPSDGLDGWRKRIGEAPHERTTFVGAFEHGALVGVAHLQGYPRPRQRHVARAWVAVDPARWGRGIGKQLLGALCDAADRWWGYVRIELDVHADHTPAIRLYESLGFEVEVKKRCDMLRDGSYVEGLHMARLRPGFVPPPEIGASPAIAAGRPRIPASELHVRPVRIDDARGLAEMHSTDSVMEGTFSLPFTSESEWRARLANNDAAAVKALVALAGPTSRPALAGSTALFTGLSPRTAHAANFGISVHPDFQGRGVGDALTKAILDLADRWMGLRRVQLEVYSDNERAQALYRKHGFEIEGVQRLVAFRRGTFVDAIVMSRIRSPREQAPQ
jgi:putative acetyltransferase